MCEFFSKQISVFINDKEHLIFVDGEVEISPSETEYGWNHVLYELGGGIEVRSIDDVYVVRYGHSKTESEIPSYAKNVERWTKPNGEVEFWWEHHRQIELNDNLEREIIGRIEELYADGRF
jgi:hypothetical protein